LETPVKYFEFVKFVIQKVVVWLRIDAKFVSEFWKLLIVTDLEY